MTFKSLNSVWKKSRTNSTLSQVSAGKELKPIANLIIKPDSDLQDTYHYQASDTDTFGKCLQMRHSEGGSSYQQQLMLA